ncbi:hypothetical protein OS493_009938 [Desmophyllum pertusum]|uniref:Uncharacterized protein n=1 Tax=Desmophyllum pertusum TaxID=174260 RepID=A0A9X0CH99_9CNID|nr:hypothetical protein OS493_009938 [Desmophyllum pertusum]
MPPSQQIDDHSSMMSDGNQNTAATIMMKKQESSEEMYHTPFLMLIKNWDWLPEHIFTSKKDDETIPVVNLTDTQNSTHISFESQENSTESNKVPCCLNISKHDHDNASLGIDNEATLDDWIEERLTGHKFEMCPWRSSKTGLELGQCSNNATRNPSDSTWRDRNLTNYFSMNVHSRKPNLSGYENLNEQLNENRKRGAVRRKTNKKSLKN